MQYTGFITHTLQEASSIAISNFGKVVGETKGLDNNQVLTATDLEIGKLIVRKIQEEYPDYNIIDEEAGVIDKQSEFTWVIDPIDGTSNFAVGSPNYGIVIGLLHKDQVIAGEVSLPFFNEITIAEKGCGAYCNGEKLSVTKETRLLSSLVVYYRWSSRKPFFDL